MSSIEVRLDCSYAVADKLCTFLRHEPIPFIFTDNDTECIDELHHSKKIRDGMGCHVVQDVTKEGEGRMKDLGSTSCRKQATGTCFENSKHGINCFQCAP